MLTYCYGRAEFVCIWYAKYTGLWRLLSYMPMYLHSCVVIELISRVVSDWIVESKCYDPRSYGCIFDNCVKNPENFRILTGFEPVTSRYRCDALTN